MTVPWRREKTKDERSEQRAAAAVQVRPVQAHPFRRMDGYVPLHRPEFALYRSIREAIPVVDAAILKLVRLAGGVAVRCGDKAVEERLGEFLRTVPAGWNQRGLQSFLDCYLDCLLTCGRAVGEIVPTSDGREIAAVLCGNVSDIEVREGGSPLEVRLARREQNGSVTVLPRQELLFFTPTAPARRSPTGSPSSTVCRFWRISC